MATASEYSPRPESEDELRRRAAAEFRIQRRSPLDIAEPPQNEEPDVVQLSPEQTPAQTKGSDLPPPPSDAFAEALAKANLLKKKRKSGEKVRMIPPEAVPETGGVDIAGLHAPQYAEGEMPADIGAGQEVAEKVEKKERKKRSPAKRRTRKKKEGDVPEPEPAHEPRVNVRKLEAEAEAVVDKNIEARHTAPRVEQHMLPSSTPLDPGLSEPAPEIPLATQKIEAKEQEAIDRRIKAAHAADRTKPEPDIEPDLTRPLEELFDFYKPGEVPPGVWEKSAHEDDSSGVTSAAEVTLAAGESLLKLNPEDIPTYIKTGNEGTRKEWQDKLRESIKWWASPEERLIRRSKELDAEAEKLGITEKSFRWLGEKYNKLGWKSKLAVGASLGIGAGVAAATVSLPAIIGFTVAIAAQRTAGLATMYLKFEKSAQDEKWGKEKAMAKAIAYTAAMTGAMMLLSEGVKEGVGYAKEHGWDDRVREWLGRMLGHDATAPEAPASAREAVGKISALPEVPQPAAVLNVGEAVVSAPALEMPTVEASTGHGYEYMMKQLWGQLHEKNVSLPANADPNSDLARLLAADESSIDKIVHQLASGPKHGFAHADGSSVRIDMGAQLTIGEHGELHLTDTAIPISHDYVFAPTHAPVTPAPHVEAPPSVPAGISSAVPVEPFPVPTEQPVTPPVHEVVPAPIETPAVPETPSVPVTDHTIESSEKPLAADITLEHPAEPPVIDITHEQDIAAQKLSEAAPPQAAAEQAGSMVNSFGLEVLTTEPHIYVSKTGEYIAYGGSKMVDAQARDYALKHHVSVFVDKSYKLLGFINVSRVAEFVPAEGGPSAMVMHTGPSVVSDPNNFTKLVE